MSGCTRMSAEIISLIDISDIVFVQQTTARGEKSVQRLPNACLLPGRRTTNGHTIERKSEKSSLLFMGLSASGFPDKRSRKPLHRTRGWNRGKRCSSRVGCVQAGHPSRRRNRPAQRYRTIRTTGAPTRRPSSPRRFARPDRSARRCPRADRRRRRVNQPMRPR